LMTVPILVSLLQLTQEAGDAFLSAERRIGAKARKLGQIQTSDLE
jgi:hypothetical protein